MTTVSATLNGTVDPEGANVTGCRLEYGATESYGQSAPCSPSPGSGKSPVAVKGALTGLGVNATYHFRLSATNEHGTNFGADHTFTTLASSETARTSEPTVPAKAKDGALSVEGSDGTGAVTIGTYESEIGGPPLAESREPTFRSITAKGRPSKRSNTRIANWKVRRRSGGITTPAAGNRSASRRRCTANHPPPVSR